MRREAGKWLEDIVTHGNDALEFLDAKAPEDYVADKALRAMVERKLFIVGEAVSQLRNVYPNVANRLPATREIVWLSQPSRPWLLRIGSSQGIRPCFKFIAGAHRSCGT